MQVSQFLSKLLNVIPVARNGGAASVTACDTNSALRQEAPLIDFSSDTTFGVKYTCRYSWQILPPAGWHKQESGMSGAWPVTGTSPSVSFAPINLEKGETAMIRWQLAGSPETDESHEQLEGLIFGQPQLTPAAVRGLNAPGLIAGMKITDADRLVLPCGLPGIIISARYEQVKGEELVFRYVLILPDRCLIANGEKCFFRETLQFIASERRFWANEKIAIESIKTFRRAETSKTAEEKGFVSGTYSAAAI